ncbi:trypsin domain-containing protein [Phthorimaea operculella]|nr:trypsin domain-containing protein [Phthorimaea operculella]
MDPLYILLLGFGFAVESSVINAGLQIKNTVKTPLSKTEAPFMAMCTPHFLNKGCAAAIVHKQFLVIPAHCWMDKLIAYVDVGIERVDDNINNINNRYEIEDVFVHPRYLINKEYSSDYDIAVIKVKKRLVLDPKVQPIKIAGLHDLDDVKNGDKLTAISYGWNTTDLKEKQFLLSERISYMDRKTCQRRLSPFHVTSVEFCAGVIEHGRGCRRNEAVVVKNGTLIGLSTMGKDCTYGLPKLFTFVPAMRDFVDDIILSKYSGSYRSLLPAERGNELNYFSSEDMSISQNSSSENYTAEPFHAHRNRNFIAVKDRQPPFRFRSLKEILPPFRPRFRKRLSRKGYRRQG